MIERIDSTTFTAKREDGTLLAMAIVRRLPNEDGPRLEEFEPAGPVLFNDGHTVGRDEVIEAAQDYRTLAKLMETVAEDMVFPPEPGDDKGSAAPPPAESMWTPESGVWSTDIDGIRKYLREQRPEIEWVTGACDWHDHVITAADTFVPALMPGHMYLGDGEAKNGRVFIPFTTLDYFLAEVEKVCHPAEMTPERLEGTLTGKAAVNGD